MTEPKLLENKAIFEEVAEKIVDRCTETSYAEQELGAVLVELSRLRGQIKRFEDDSTRSDVIRALVPIRSRLFDLSVPSYRAKLVKNMTLGKQTKRKTNGN
jgi:hypothetical protein